MTQLLIPQNQMLSNYDDDFKKTKVRETLRAITGKKDILKEKAVEVLSLYEKLDYEEILEVSKCAIDRYDDMMLYPSKKWWKGLVHDVLRSRRLRTGETIMDKYNRPDDAERERVKKIARETAERFATGDEVVEPSLYQKKVQRYKDHAELGDVLIIDANSERDGEWVSKAVADSIGVEYREPLQWLDRQQEKGKQVGNIQKIIDKL